MPNRSQSLIKIGLVFFVMAVTGLIGLGIRLVSAGILTNWNRRVYFRWQSKFLLRILGMKLEVPSTIVLPEHPVLITFNHNSYLDVLILVSLGFTNTRFIISEKTRRIFPVTLSALAIGAMYIPQQFDPERRLAFFKKTTDEVIKKRFSIAASSEGVHEHFHGIGKFNRGVYHLAMAGGLDILPLFIYVPEASNPFNHYGAFSKGIVRIEALPLISTHDWKLKDLDRHKAEVRQLFVEKFNQCHHTAIT